MCILWDAILSTASLSSSGRGHWVLRRCAAAYSRLARSAFTTMASQVLPLGQHIHAPNTCINADARLRADRPVHRQQNLGRDEDRALVHWHSSRLRRLRPRQGPGPHHQLVRPARCWQDALRRGNERACAPPAVRSRRGRPGHKGSGCRCRVNEGVRYRDELEGNRTY